MDVLQEIQNWYSQQCDGDWEHSYGITIDTLDNPGWTVRIDLFDTDCLNRPFQQIARGDSESDQDWIYCKVESNQFLGTSGPKNLNEILGIFLHWAKRESA